MGGETKVARHKQHGALTARERIDALLDEETFFEVGLLNHSDQPGMEERTPADGKICGYGRIAGRDVAVVADDRTVLAGTGGRVGFRKSETVINAAIARGFPIVALCEGGGARLPDIQGSDGLSSMGFTTASTGRRRQVPSATAILGDSFGQPNWKAALSDFSVQVRGTCLAVSGPRVLEVATGEKIDALELGGVDIHTKQSGLIDRAAADEVEAIHLVQRFLSYLPSHSGQTPPKTQGDPTAEDRQSSLETLVPEAPKRAYDMANVVETIVDAGSVFQIKPDFDKSVITCLARLDGEVIGIIASNPKFSAGAMGPNGCIKSTIFICLCDSFNIPLLFLHDIPGFFVGKAAEERGIAAKIIMFLQALALSSVPKISLIVRKSYGMAFSNMAGYGMGADFHFAWPGSDISFMAPSVAKNVMNGLDHGALSEEALREASRPWKAAGLGYLDDVIEPSQTRRVLIASFRLARGSRHGLSERRLADWPTGF